MFCDPHFEAIRSANNVLGSALNHGAPIIVDNDLVASLLLFPSTIRSAAVEQALSGSNNFHKISNDSYKALYANTKSEWQLRNTNVPHHPYRRQNVQNSGNVISSVRSLQRPLDTDLGGLSHTVMPQYVIDQKPPTITDTPFVLSELNAPSVQCIQPSLTQSGSPRTVPSVTNGSSVQVLSGSPIQISQTLVVPVGLMGQAPLLTPSTKPADMMSLGTQLNIPTMGTSVSVTNPLPLSSFVKGFELPVPTVTSVPMSRMTSFITPNVSPLSTTFGDSADLFPASLGGSSTFRLGALDFNSLMLSVGGNQPGFSFFPPMETPATNVLPSDPVITVTLNGGLPSPLTTDIDLANLTAFTGSLSALDGYVTAVPMGNVSPPDVGNVELTTVEPVGAEQALSPQAPTFTKCSPPPQERNAVERSPERHRESSECSEFVFVDEDETESTDSGSDFEFPSKSGSSRRGRQAAGRRSGHKQSALDHRRSSIVSTVSEISCVSSCDSEYSVAESTRGQQRRQANPKRNQQQEDCDSDKRRHWSCEQCGKRFTRKFNLGQHMRIHSGRKPYVCQVENCGMAFVRDYDRKRHHISVHDLDKPFKCTHCDLQFPRTPTIVT